MSGAPAARPGTGAERGRRPRVVVLDDYEDASRRLADWSRIEASADVVVHTRQLAPDAASRVLSDADVVVLTRDRTAFGADLAASLPRLSYLVFTGGRNSRLDLAALKARGIPVSHTGWGPSKDSTCEVTWALILAASKHLEAAFAATRRGGWREGWTLPPVLHGQRLGVVGLGEIGRRVAQVGQAFGMQIVTWSPHMTPERAATSGATAVPLDELLSTSLVVTVHLVLGATTRNLFGAAQFASMRSDSVFVNTSRSGLVDEPALVAALKAGRPGCAALDVFDREPLPSPHPLHDAPNVLLSPHIGFVAEPVMRQQWEDVVASVEAWLEGKTLPRRADE